MAANTRTVVLVACASRKALHTAPAGDLYQSPLFRKSRVWAERNGDAWYILSARHGLSQPDTVIAPYEATLRGASRGIRKEWGAKVAEAIALLEPRSATLYVLAGRDYRAHLVPLLTTMGYKVNVPMAGLGIGRQLAWLTQQNSNTVTPA